MTAYGEGVYDNFKCEVGTFIEKDLTESENVELKNFIKNQRDLSNDIVMLSKYRNAYWQTFSKILRTYCDYLEEKYGDKLK